MEQSRRTIAHSSDGIKSAYNARIFKGISLASAIILAMLFLVALVPNIDIFSQPAYLMLYGITLMLFLLYATLSLVALPFVHAHATLLLYACFLTLHVFSVLLNLEIMNNRHDGFPYTLSLGFLLVQPILIRDNDVRVALWSGATALAYIAISLLVNSGEFILIDIINCFLFGMGGIAFGQASRTYIAEYLDMKDREMKHISAENRAKSAFLAHISHEIRTPLNAVLGLNEMILRESEKPSVKSYAGDIKLAGKMLLSIINDILDFSKIETNEFSLTPVEYSLDSTINDLLNMIVPKTQEKNLSCAVEIEKTTPNILYGDELRIKQCVINLLTNAVKYTEHGTITLKVNWEPSTLSERNIRLSFAVADTGSGMRQEELHKLFRPFERLDEIKNRSIEGSGLGLAIVHGILQKMDSKLLVETTYGKGSEFSFTVEQTVIKDEPIGAYEERLHSITSGQPSRYHSFIAPKARILVVDDLKMNLDVICGLLSCTQMRIDTATSGMQAVQLVRDVRYDIIFIDHRMPIMDGIETLQAMRQLGDIPSARAVYIALTANAIQGSKQLYLQNGFHDYLSKPIDCEKLEQMLIRYLPPELVTLRESEGITQEKEQAFLSRYQNIAGVDCDSAVENCGNGTILKQAVNDYCTGVDAQIADLQRHAGAADWQSYTVIAHALKTALRLLGIQELSKQAAYLESCGDRKDSNEILERSPEFISQLRRYKALLETANPPKKNIPLDQLENALRALQECAQSSDMQTAANILSMMDEYLMPPVFEEQLSQIRQAIRNKNGTLLQNLIQDFFQQTGLGTEETL